MMKSNKTDNGQTPDAFQSMVKDARQRLSESGFAFSLSGIALFIVGISQFLLLHSPYNHFSNLPYLLLPPLSLVIFYYYWKKYKPSPGKDKKSHNNLITNTLSMLGLSLSLNFMILGFFFQDALGSMMFPFLFLLLSIFLVTVGAILKFRPFIFTGLATNMLTFITISLPEIYHPGIFALVGLIGIYYPGIMLQKLNKLLT